MTDIDRQLKQLPIAHGRRNAPVDHQVFTFQKNTQINVDKSTVSFRPQGPHSLTATPNSPAAKLEAEQNRDLNPLASCQNKDKPIQLALNQIGHSPKLKIIDHIDQSPYLDGNFDNMINSFNAQQQLQAQPPIPPPAQHRQLSFGGGSGKKKLKGQPHHVVADQLKKMQDEAKKKNQELQKRKLASSKRETRAATENGPDSRAAPDGEVLHDEVAPSSFPADLLNLMRPNTKNRIFPKEQEEHFIEEVRSPSRNAGFVNKGQTSPLNCVPQEGHPFVYLPAQNPSMAQGNLSVIQSICSKQSSTLQQIFANNVSGLGTMSQRSFGPFRQSKKKLKRKRNKAKNDDILHKLQDYSSMDKGAFLPSQRFLSAFIRLGVSPSSPDLPSYLLRNSTLFKNIVNQAMGRTILHNKAVYLKIFQLFHQSAVLDSLEARRGKAARTLSLSFQKFMVSVEKCLYYLQDQYSFEGISLISLEDVLNILCAEIDDKVYESVFGHISIHDHDSTEKIEILSQKNRLKKMNHKFVLFKNVSVDPASGKKTLQDGSNCPICSNNPADADQDFQISSNFYMPKTFQSHIDMQNFQKLISMARFKSESNNNDLESGRAPPPKGFLSKVASFFSGTPSEEAEGTQKIRVQFYGETKILFHNSKMIKKLVRQEIVRGPTPLANNNTRASHGKSQSLLPRPDHRPSIISTGGGIERANTKVNIVKRGSVIKIEENAQQAFSSIENSNEMTKEQRFKESPIQEGRHSLLQSSILTGGAPELQNTSSFRKYICNEGADGDVGDFKMEITDLVDAHHLEQSQHMNNLQIVSEGFELKQEPFMDRPQYNLDLNTAQIERLEQSSMRAMQLPPEGETSPGHLLLKDPSSQVDSHEPMGIKFEQMHSPYSHQNFAKALPPPKNEGMSSVSISYRGDNEGFVDQLQNYEQYPPAKQGGGKLYLKKKLPPINKALGKPQGFGLQTEGVADKQYDSDLIDGTPSHHHKQYQFDSNFRTSQKQGGASKVPELDELEAVDSVPISAAQSNPFRKIMMTNPHTSQAVSVQGDGNSSGGVYQPKKVVTRPKQNPSYCQSKRSQGPVSIEDDVGNLPRNLGNFIIQPVQHESDILPQLVFPMIQEIQEDKKAEQSPQESKEGTLQESLRKSSQFVEFTEVFGENDNCDICGLPFEKHNTDNNFEVHQKLDRMNEVLNQTCHNPSLHGTLTHNMHSKKPSQLPAAALQMGDPKVLECLEMRKASILSPALEPNSRATSVGRNIEAMDAQEAYSIEMNQLRAPIPRQTHSYLMNENGKLVPATLFPNQKSIDPNEQKRGSLGALTRVSPTASQSSKLKRKLKLNMQEIESKSKRNSAVAAVTGKTDSKMSQVQLKQEINLAKLENVPKSKPQLLIGDLLGKSSSLVVKSKFLTHKQEERKEFFQFSDELPPEQKEMSEKSSSRMIPGLTKEALKELEGYFSNQKLCQICYNEEVPQESAGNEGQEPGLPSSICHTCRTHLQKQTEAIEIGDPEAVIDSSDCHVCGLPSHAQESEENLRMKTRNQTFDQPGSSKQANILINPQSLQANMGPQLFSDDKGLSCNDNIQSLYTKIKLRQFRKLWESAPGELLDSAFNYQFCISCDRVLKKMNSLRCQHMTCEACKITFCLFCREILYSFQPSKQTGKAMQPSQFKDLYKDHFNPFSLNSCKMQNSTKNYKRFQEQIRIKENLHHASALDSNLDNYTDLLFRTRRESAKHLIELPDVSGVPGTGLDTPQDFQDYETPEKEDKLPSVGGGTLPTHLSQDSSGMKENSYFMNISTYLAARFEKDSQAHTVYYEQNQNQIIEKMIGSQTLAVLKVLLIIAWVLLGPFLSIAIGFYALVCHGANAVSNREAPLFYSNRATQGSLKHADFYMMAESKSDRSSSWASSLLFGLLAVAGLPVIIALIYIGGIIGAVQAWRRSSF